MDRCLHFAQLVIYPELKDSRDELFRFIAITSMYRAEQELKAYGYTRYPLIREVTNIERLTDQEFLIPLEQERYVNLVLEALKAKKAISMAGARFA